MTHISFDLKKSFASINKLKTCTSDVRAWMINNKLRINDRKTEFLMLKSYFNKFDLSELALAVGDDEIAPSSSANNLFIA